MALATSQGTINRFDYFPTAAFFVLILGFTVVSVSLVTDDSGMGKLYLLMMVQFTPFLISVATKRPNFIAYVMFYHLVTYSIAKYNQIVSIHNLEFLYPAAEASVNQLIICSLLIVLSYFLARILITPARVKTEPFNLLILNRNQLIAIGAYVLMHNFLVRYLPANLRTIQFVVNTAAVVLLVSSKTPGFERLQKFCIIGAIGSAFYHFLTTGMLALLGSVGLLFFMTACLRRKPRQMAYVVLFSLAVIAIQPVKAQFRVEAGLNPTLSAFTKISVLFNLIGEEYFGDGVNITEDDDVGEKDEETSSTLLKGFSRIGDDSLERVLAWTPEKVPYWGGETYANIPYIFIPRFLWPSKPKHIIWNKFGRTYGFLSPNDYSTSVGIGYLGEAYMNFGFLGMYSIALLMGIIIALAELFAFALLGHNFVFSFVCLVIPVMTYAGDFGSILNSIVIMTAILVLARTYLMRMAKQDLYSR